MTPTIEMLNAYFEEFYSHLDDDVKMIALAYFWGGVAAYAHLSSPASEQWRKEHGFSTEGGEI